MKIYSVAEIIEIARKKSPYYKELYKHLPERPVLSELPVIDSDSFWKINTLENNQLLTESQNDGIVFKSGGTTGNPKFSFFTLDEWELFTLAFGEGMMKGGLKKGDKIANMFYAGDLYASFLFITKSIEKSLSQAIHFPIGGGTDFDHIIQTLNEFKINVWAGIPTTMVKLAEYAEKNKLQAPDKILFGGESMYADQKEFILSIFPKVHIQSIGYASVDGGLLGFADSTCAAQVHRVFSDHTIMEILDEDTLEPITESGKTGKFYLTNLTRTLMPIIRYPVGDKAQWIEEDSADTPYRRFKIMGRSEEGARIGPATVYYEDMSLLLSHYHEHFNVKAFQLVTKHFENKDQLVVKVATTSRDLKEMKHLENIIEKERSFLKDLSEAKQIHPVKVEFVDISSLQTNGRTGKLKRVIDERKT